MPIYRGTRAADAFQRSLGKVEGAVQRRKKHEWEQANEFQEALKVDPISVMSHKLMSEQANAMDEYTKKWTQRMSERGGNLTMQDKAEMTADKQKMMADQGQWQASNKMMLNDISRFREGVHDPLIFQQKIKEGLDTGVYRGDGSWVLHPVLLVMLQPQHLWAGLLMMK
jgi:hypothetical protein